MKPEVMVISDVHLSLRPPGTWNGPDWFSTIRNRFKELRSLAKCPLIIAGDIFDTWNVSPEVINLGLECIPRGTWVIPGQHDLPNHRSSAIHRSGLGTLIESGHCRLLPAEGVQLGSYCYYGIGWGQKIPEPARNQASIAVLHAYVWKTGFHHPGADKSQKHNRYPLQKFWAAFFGDNHLRFSASAKGALRRTRIYNCGAFFRRKSDEMRSKPSVWLVSKGEVQDVALRSAFSDSFVTKSKQQQDVPDFSEFLGGVLKVGENSYDYTNSVRRAMTRLNRTTQKAILEVLAECSLQPSKN